MLWLSLVLSGKFICPQVEKSLRQSHWEVRAGAGELSASLESERVSGASPCSRYPIRPAPCHPPHRALAGEAYSLLDGVQDTPHVLIHLQALKQSGFTGKKKKKRGGLAFALAPWRVGAEPSPPHCVEELCLCCRFLRDTVTGGSCPVTAGDKRTAHCPLRCSEHLCRVGVPCFAFRAGAGSCAPDSRARGRLGSSSPSPLGGEPPAGAASTHLHTGHLQVPLSQFSCRYDSRSKHCRGQETGRQTDR